jgi:hypothetical protein
MARGLTIFSLFCVQKLPILMRMARDRPTALLARVSLRLPPLKIDL